MAAAGAGHITAAAVVQLERAHCCGMHTCCCATRLIRSQQPFKISQCTLALLPSSVCTTKRSVSTICRPSTSAALIRANSVLTCERDPVLGGSQGFTRHSSSAGTIPRTNSLQSAVSSLCFTSRALISTSQTARQRNSTVGYASTWSVQKDIFE